MSGDAEIREILFSNDSSILAVIRFSCFMLFCSFIVFFERQVDQDVEEAGNARWEVEDEL